MPFTNFEKIQTIDDVMEFFGDNFPDAIDLIGEKRLSIDFFKTKPQHLVSIKCNPFFVDAGVLLLGDAAHAVVPFYGQGMNAGFEDCTILSELLDRHNNQLPKVVKEFSEIRWEDAHAISDLAMYNYIEV